jgi:sugar lactone lactonase YvrE
MRMFPIPGDNVFPEGITEGPGTSFFVGSTGDGAIYRGDTATGIVEPFLPPDGDGRVSICGLDVDDHGRLIACDFRGAQVFAYDLATRALAARRRLPSADALPNDVVVHGDWAYVTDSRHPVVWRLPAGPGQVGDPSVAIDLARYNPADPAYLNGIVCHPDQPLLLIASQGEGGTLWRVDAATATAGTVDLGGYDFNADGMLLDGDMLYGVTHRGTVAGGDFRAMITALRLAPDWESGTIVGELTDERWASFPTTIAKVGGELLVVCSQFHTQRLHIPPELPFTVAASEFPSWREPRLAHRLRPLVRHTEQRAAGRLPARRQGSRLSTRSRGRKRPVRSGWEATRAPLA